MFRNHQVTVGVIFMNPNNITRFGKTVKSIRENSLFNIELVIINNSPEDFHSCFHNYFYEHFGESSSEFERDNLVLINQPEQKSCAENWNTIYENATSPVIIFCNDDIIVNQYFDKIIYDKLMDYTCDKPLGICSFPEAYPHETLLNKDWNYENCRSDSRHIVSGFNGACFGVRKSLLDEVVKWRDDELNTRPFDVEYKLGGYEDLDFHDIVCNHMGYRAEVCFDSFIFHYGASTRNSDVVKELQKTHTGGEYHLDYNRKIFLRKWNWTEETLEKFEAEFYKGWNIDQLNHPVWHSAQRLLKEEES